MFNFQTLFVNLSEREFKKVTLSNGEEVTVVVVTVLSGLFKHVNTCGGFLATRNERNERLILVSDQAKERLTPEEFEAVLAHEVGHHELGHVPNFSLAEAGQVILDQGIEIEADAYAVSQTSKHALKSALGASICLATGIKSRRAAALVLWLSAPRRMWRLL